MPSSIWADGPEHLHFSFSQISTYLRCPEQFRLKYVVGHRPSHRTCEEVLGSTMHGALAVLHEHHRTEGAKPPVERVVAEFDALLDTACSGPMAILWADEDSPEKLRTTGHELLKLYHQTVNIHRVVAVEKRFLVRPEDLPPAFKLAEDLVGVVDLIEEDATGATWVTELKTAGRRFDDQRLTYDLQLSLYAAVRRALGVPEAKLRFRVLLKTKKPAIVDHEVHRGPTQVDEAGRVTSQVLRAIDTGIFYPVRGWACSACPFRSPCGE